ncbi:hypothetical protein RUND412_001272 [Rhizina undulata]
MAARFEIQTIFGVVVRPVLRVGKGAGIAGLRRKFGASTQRGEWMDVNGKTAVITGAGSGISLEFARLLISKNCKVIVGDISLTPSAKTLLAGNPQSVAFHHTDVTSWADLRSLIAFSTETFGPPDIVVPGAGIYEPPFSNFYLDTEKYSTDSTYKTLEINLTHPIRLTRLAISSFVASNKPGAVIHISSIAGQSPNLPFPIYAATKFGLSGFVRSMEKLEREIGIRVSAVAPGVIRTPLWTERPEKLKMIDEGVDEWVEPEEVAEAMLHLVESDVMRGGTILEVGKGQTRVVTTYMDPGPSGPGHTVAKNYLSEREVLAILKAERDENK